MVGLLVTDQVARFFVQAHPCDIVMGLDCLVMDNGKRGLRNSGLLRDVAHFIDLVDICVGHGLAAYHSFGLQIIQRQHVLVVTHTVCIAV